MIWNSAYTCKGIISVSIITLQTKLLPSSATKFPLPLNVPYCPQITKSVVGAMAEPLHT